MLTQLKLNYLTMVFIHAKYLFVYLTIVVLISACSSEKTGPQISGLSMGTSYSIQWTEDSDTSINDTIEAQIIDRLDHINRLMSTYINDSELSQFNQSRDTGWHAVDVELATLVERALKICHQTSRAFDITVGPLVNLWGFGASDSNFHFPTDTEIKIAMRSIGCHHLQVRLSPPAINKNVADIYVDLSAIAKGYAVDELANILDTHGMQNYMVEIGGEVKAKGIAPHGNAWRIGIETPSTQRSGIEEVLSLSNIAVATSGDYRNYIEHEGKHYSHTIDPRNGYPIKHQLASVTIVHSSAATADAWATAFMVLGANKTLEIANSHNLSGLLITRHGAKYSKTTFGNIRDYIAN